MLAPDRTVKRGWKTQLQPTTVVGGGYRDSDAVLFAELHAWNALARSVVPHIRGDEPGHRCDHEL
jgi:hypothetical protein